MKCRTKPVVTIGSAYHPNRVIPDDAAGPLQSLPQHGFLNLELPVVPNMLPVAAARSVVVRTVRSLPVRRRLNNGCHASRGVVLLPIEDFHFNHISWRGARDKKYSLFGAGQA